MQHKRLEKEIRERLQNPGHNGEPLKHLNLGMTIQNFFLKRSLQATQHCGHGKWIQSPIPSAD
jgi:hypothetical protein